MGEEDHTDEMIQLIPLVGVIYQRYTTAWDRYQMSDMILSLIFPSIFGVTKLDSAGTTYHSRPIGLIGTTKHKNIKTHIGMCLV